MGDTTVKKVDSSHSPHGSSGQKYLASGKSLPGNSWVVPRGAEHAYRILEPFTAVEATAPPAQVHGRDEAR